jgi:glutamine amidotransferase
MCQLLGMNCNVPTDICFSFSGFSARGGKTDVHADGWGIGFFEDNGCRLFVDPKPAAESPLAQWIKQYPIHSKNVIAHIRKATHGPVALQNTHPFRRELWGRYWLFAHNGTLDNFSFTSDTHYRPVGETDSELAFCYLLTQLRLQFKKQPGGDVLFKALREITDQLSSYGTFNFLLSNGEQLFAHCSNNLHYVLRRSPFGFAHLSDQDMTIDFRDHVGSHDKVAVIATAPLTDDEIWTQFTPGQLLLFKDGEPVKF